MRLKAEEKQQLLETANVEERLRAISAILSRELEVIELGSKIQSQVQSEMEKGQREYFLRQQLKAIQEELGEGDEQQAEVNELREQLAELELPEDVRKAAERELSRLEKLPPAAAEYGVIRTYLDWILTLPWDKVTEDNLDLEQARRILDEDHFDLEKVKDRIVEYLAVSKLKGDVSGPILCFVGPPGVGKTSLGQSIARTLGRKFTRISVGGVRDESEIRGHRRTYIGAMPGHDHPRDPRRRVEEPGLPDRRDRQDGRRLARRPGQRDARGARPGAALDIPRPLPRPPVRPLEGAVHLHREPAGDDPRAAARPDGRDPALRLHRGREGSDREALPGTEAARSARALARSSVEIDDDALRTIVREYTREAGLRNLERRIADVLRKTARRVAEARAETSRIDEPPYAKHSARAASPGEARKRTSDPGVATGLAVTAVGGDVLFIEATAYPGQGRPAHHRPARRGHAGVGPGGALLGAQPRGAARNRPGMVRGTRHPHPRPGRRGAQGRAFGRA